MTQTTPYYTPQGGLPGQTELLTDRAIVTEAYTVIPRGVLRDIVTSNLPGWDKTRLWVLARPIEGFATTFAQYVMEVSPGGGSDQGEDEETVQSVVFVTEGTLVLTLAGVEHVLEPGGYAYLAAGERWALHNRSDAKAAFQWIRKVYEPDVYKRQVDCGALTETEVRTATGLDLSLIHICPAGRVRRDARQGHRAAAGRGDGARVRARRGRERPRAGHPAVRGPGRDAAGAARGRRHGDGRPPRARRAGSCHGAALRHVRLLGVARHRRCVPVDGAPRGRPREVGHAARRRGHGRAPVGRVDERPARRRPPGRRLSLIHIFHNLMEDAATAEISRSQVWQWVRSGASFTAGESAGTTVTTDLVRTLLREETARLRDDVGHEAYDAGPYDRAAALVEDIALNEHYVDFLTLPAYEDVVAHEQDAS